MHILLFRSYIVQTLSLRKHGTSISTGLFYSVFQSASWNGGNCERMKTAKLTKLGAGKRLRTSQSNKCWENVFVWHDVIFTRLWLMSVAHSKCDQTEVVMCLKMTIYKLPYYWMKSFVLLKENPHCTIFILLPIAWPDVLGVSVWNHDFIFSTRKPAILIARTWAKAVEVYHKDCSMRTDLKKLSTEYSLLMNNWQPNMHSNVMPKQTQPCYEGLHFDELSLHYDGGTAVQSMISRAGIINIFIMFRQKIQCSSVISENHY